MTTQKKYAGLLFVAVVLLSTEVSAGGASSDGVLADIARLEAELARGTVSEFTVKAVTGSRDPRTVGVLLAVLAAPESLRRRSLSGFEFAVRGLGSIGDPRAVPGLQRFLKLRLEAERIPDDSFPFGGVYPTGRIVNYQRRLEALHAARALYTLGGWSTALRALDTLVHDPYVVGLPLHHLYLAAQLDVERFAAGTEARESTVTFLRRACASPDLLVQAHAAHSLAAADPDISYSTAVRLLSTGPDESPRSRSYLVDYKRVAINTLAANRSAQSRESLEAIARNGGPLAQVEALEALSRRGRREQ